MPVRAANLPTLEITRFITFSFPVASSSQRRFNSLDSSPQAPCENQITVERHSSTRLLTLAVAFSGTTQVLLTCTVEVLSSLICGSTRVKFPEARRQWSDLLTAMRTDHWEVVRSAWDISWLLHMQARVRRGRRTVEVIVMCRIWKYYAT